MFFKYLRQYRKSFLYVIVCNVIFAYIFYLAQLPVEAVAYAFLLCFFLGAILILIDYIRFITKQEQ